jgi:hypothetical protein
MSEKKPVAKSRTKMRSVDAETSANGRGAEKKLSSKRKKSQLTANELTLIAWKHLYAKRDRFGKLD